MDDPIKIILKYKNNYRRIQYHTYIFIGTVPNDIYPIDNRLLLYVNAAKNNDIEFVHVPVNKLRLVQQTYNPGICLQYLHDKKIREYETNTLPFLVQLDEDDEYLVFNGTHRVIGLQQAYDPNYCAPISAQLLRLSRADIELDYDDSDKLAFYAEVLDEALEIIQGEEIYG